MEEQATTTNNEEILNEQAEEQVVTPAEGANEEAEKSVEETEKPVEETDADKLAAALNEIAVLKEKYIRQVAEFDNYRKRTLKEKTELILNGGEKVLGSLLPVLDDLDRAMTNIEKSSEVETLKEGVALIVDKLTKTLEAQGLHRMDTIGKVFDTDYHEAIAQIPAPEEGLKNHVVDCVQPGYLLNEKVIRHAKVVVGQ